MIRCAFLFSNELKKKNKGTFKYMTVFRAILDPLPHDGILTFSAKPPPLTNTENTAK